MRLCVRFLEFILFDLLVVARSCKCRIKINCVVLMLGEVYIGVLHCSIDVAFFDAYVVYMLFAFDFRWVRHIWGVSRRVGVRYE